MKKKISLDEWTMLGAYNRAQPWARRLCSYKLEKISEGHYRREQFISLPIYFLLFIPASIIQAVWCMWDGGLKEFEKTPYAERLRKTGVITSYICPLMYMNNPLSTKMPVITSSNKLRTYTSARYYTDDEILVQITKGGRK